MELCAYLLSAMIVGAYEYKPGMMYVQVLPPESEIVEEVYVYTDTYLGCFENGLPVQQPGAADS